MAIFAGETYSHAEVVTPHASNAQGTLATKSCDAIYVGGTGHLELVMAGGGATVLLSAIPAGTLLPVKASRVLAASTTATLIVALWH